MNKKKILYLNNTAYFPHIGCIAVTYAHLKMLHMRNVNIQSFGVTELKEYWKGTRHDSLRYIEDSDLSTTIDHSDAVVINGEGTIHHNKGLHLLSIAEYCKSIGKRVYLINCTIEGIDGFDDVLKSLDDLVCREFRTFQYLKRKVDLSRINSASSSRLS